MIEKIGGYKKAAHVVKNRLPTGKAIRSGDLGEILATEYVDQETNSRVPIKRLRYKDDQQMAMRGDDVIAVRPGPKRMTQVLKVEAKSRGADGRGAPGVGAHGGRVAQGRGLQPAGQP